ncbi:MAG: site-specific integrase [Acidimicrobiaceae bacterium]|nr:site-specific integrase [Acidimicrobiaceae bacterium]
MAQLIHHVLGRRDGVRVDEIFRATDEGRRAAQALYEQLGGRKSARRTYQVRTRIDGRSVSRTFRTRDEADAYASAVETDKRRGTAIDPRQSQLPVADVAARWLKAGTTKRASSRARDTAIVEHHIKPTLGKRPVAVVTRADVQALVDGWAQAGAPSTVVRQYACLRAIFAWAEASELISKNPCRKIRLPAVGEVHHPVLAEEELQRLAAVLGDDAAMMWLGVVLGLRWAEVAGLTVGCVDFLPREGVRRQAA